MPTARSTPTRSDDAKGRRDTIKQPLTTHHPRRIVPSLLSLVQLRRFGGTGGVINEAPVRTGTFVAPAAGVGPTTESRIGRDLRLPKVDLMRQLSNFEHQIGRPRPPDTGLKPYERDGFVDRDKSTPHSSPLTSIASSSATWPAHRSMTSPASSPFTARPSCNTSSAGSPATPTCPRRPARRSRRAIRAGLVPGSDRPTLRRPRQHRATGTSRGRRPNARQPRTRPRRAPVRSQSSHEVRPRSRVSQYGT